MSVTEKIDELKRIMKEEEEKYYRDYPETREEDAPSQAKEYGPGLYPPISLPIWNSDETVPASPMVTEWFQHANGWSEFALGRRALSIEEMRDPWVGIKYHCNSEYETEEDRHQHLERNLGLGMKWSLKRVHEDPMYLSLENPKIVLFSLPIMSEIVGAEFLVFADNLAGGEPMVFRNDYVTANLEDMLDRLIAG